MKINKIFLLKTSLVLFVLGYLLNSFSLYPFEFFNVVESSTGNKIRVSHVMFIPFWIITVYTCRYVPKLYLGVFGVLVFFIVYSLIASQIWWSNHYIINYIWSAIGFLMACMIATKIKDIDQIIDLFLFATIIFYVLVCFKNIVYSHEIIDFIKNPIVHPVIPSLIGGGLNIESSSMAMMSFFAFKRKKLFSILIAICFICAVMYASRVGIISSLLVLLIITYGYSENKLKFILQLTLLCFLTAILFYILLLNEVYIAERFMNVGDKSEAGSRGRLNMWVWIMPALAMNLWGYGAGNAIEAISYVANWDFDDNNIHLYPIQVLLDFGILGFLFYLFCFCFFIRKVFIVKNDSYLFYGFILTYLLLGGIQFKGGEVLMYLVAGFGLSLDRIENMKG